MAKRPKANPADGSEGTLTDRERMVLEAVVRTYVSTAEPAGSRRVARAHDMAVSPATIRNTMSDLEEKGYLFHPHTSAGRVPTDLAYRYFVDRLMRHRPLTTREREEVAQKLDFVNSPVDELVRGVARVLGFLTQELGVAVAPQLAEAVLSRLELVKVSESKVLLVATIQSGTVRTVYVDLGITVPEDTVVGLTLILNERLAGLTLSQLRETLPERLRDSAGPDDEAARRFLNIFLETGSELFEPHRVGGNGLHLGHASVLATQPEFTQPDSLRALLELTERRDVLAEAVDRPDALGGLRITIGQEHESEELMDFSLVTAPYVLGEYRGVIGVMGPTRMPYEKVIAIVDYTSSLITRMLKS